MVSGVMGLAIHLHDDQWGAIIDRPDDGYIEIRWYDTTRDLDRATFNEWLAMFVGHVEKHPRPGVLVDSTNFQMDMANMDGEWRDANVIPRYDAAGVKKFAFHMPAGMPAIGSDPVPEGPASFPTGYFGRRTDALAWLSA